MMLKTGAIWLAKRNSQRLKRWINDPLSLQKEQFGRLIEMGRKTRFGREHGFDEIHSHADFAQKVPIRDYEEIKPYIDLIIQGESDVLWPGRPKYFAKTSGTTSGAKFIPVTPESMPNQVDGARLSLLNYIHQTGNTRFIKGKYIFISGSPVLENTGGIPSGRLSGIAHRNLPFYLRHKRLPSFKTNATEPWERKLDLIIQETLSEKMSLISGIPPWLIMYFERLLEKTGKSSVRQVFPQFDLMVHGGVNFSQYRKKVFSLIGHNIDDLETFPASEGFFAFQDRFPSEGMLLIPDGGIFYEFVPAERFYNKNPPRLSLAEVEAGPNYALVLSTNAGLWSYSIGDTVRFVSTFPHRLVVSGRLSQYTSAFGEHVIAEEAETAITHAASVSGAVVREFTLAPLVENPGGLPCHQWFVEFSRDPGNEDLFRQSLDENLQQKNLYYRDLRQGNILQQAMLIKVPPGSFHAYMASKGKIGGQNKVPHLSNEREIADYLLDYKNSRPLK